MSRSDPSLEQGRRNAAPVILIATCVSALLTRIDLIQHPVRRDFRQL